MLKGNPYRHWRLGEGRREAERNGDRERTFGLELGGMRRSLSGCGKGFRDPWWSVLRWEKG